MPYRVLPIATFLPELAVVIMVLVGAIVMLVGAERQLLVGATPLGCLAFGGWLYFGLRVNGMDYPDTLVWPVMSLFAAGCVSYAGLSLRRHGLSRLACVLLASMWIAASFGTGLLQWYQLFHPAQLEWWVLPRLQDMQPYGNLAQRNHAALVHALAMASCTYLAAQARTPLARFALAFFGLFALCGLVLTGSRMGSVLGGMVAVAVVATMRVNGRILGAHPLGLVWRALFGIGIYAAAYIALQAWLFSWPALQGIHDAGTRWATYGNGSRQALYELAWAVFSANPISGAGWASFSNEALARVDQFSSPQYATHAHNLFAHLAAETGLVGLILVLLPILWCLSTLFLERLNRENVYLACAVAMFLGHSMTEYPLWYAFFLLPFVFTLGLLDRSIIAAPVSRAMKLTGVLFCALILAGSFYAASRFLTMSRLVHEVFRPGLVSSEVRSQVQGIVNSPGFSAQTELLMFGLLYVDKDNLKEKIEIGRRVSRYQIDAYLLQKQASLLALDGQMELAAQHLVLACRFYPDRCGPVLSQIGILARLDPATFEPLLARLGERVGPDGRLKTKN